MADALNSSLCTAVTTDEVRKLVICNTIWNEIINMPICLVRRIVYT